MLHSDCKRQVKLLMANCAAATQAAHGPPTDEQVLLHSILPISVIVQLLVVWLLLYLA